MTKTGWTKNNSTAPTPGILQNEVDDRGNQRDEQCGDGYRDSDHAGF